MKFVRSFLERIGNEYNIALESTSNKIDVGIDV